MPTTAEFLDELRAQLGKAEQLQLAYLDVNSGELHRRLGDYTSASHHMSSCCQAMYAEQNAGDQVVGSPPKGRGATLTIRYRLPR